MIITDPLQYPSITFVHYIREQSDTGNELELSEIEAFGKFSKEVLFSEGYIVVIIPFLSNYEWYNARHKLD